MSSMKVDRKGPSVKKASRKVSTRDSRLLFQLGRIEYAINRQHQIDELPKEPEDATSLYAKSLRETDSSFKEWLKRARERAKRQAPRSVREPALYLHRNPDGATAPPADFSVPLDRLLPDGETCLPVRHPDIYATCATCKKPVRTSEAGAIEPANDVYWYRHSGCYKTGHKRRRPATEPQRRAKRARPAPAPATPAGITSPARGSATSGMSGALGADAMQRLIAVAREQADGGGAS